WPLAQAAADFKSRHKMSYADAFTAALAKQKRTHLVTGDKEFRSLGAEVNTVWL
ncbi:MAG: PIN domain-containing protein, partial [Verrucomicrobia bacterium]|nr:PIN domain-containing protein [Verrucomicrobiota bacterium]